MRLLRLSVILAMLGASLAINVSTIASTGAQPAVNHSATGLAQPEQSVRLLDAFGAAIHPTNVLAIGEDLYLLHPEKMWCVPGGYKRASTAKALFAIDVGPAQPKIGKVPVQEFSTFCYVPARKSIAVLDKSGDIFEYSPAKMTWSVLRPNVPFGSPDPEYLDIAASESGKNVVLLDPERNQIWRFPATNQRYFREVLPWRLHAGDISVADGIAIANDGFTWVMRRSGSIAKFLAPSDAGMGHQMPFRWNTVKGMRPSRMVTGSKDMPLYVVERENNRVIAVDKATGKSSQFLFASDSDLRGALAEKNGFWIVDGDCLVRRDLASADSPEAKPQQRSVDNRLLGLHLPLKGSALPGHPGVWAGARRLYRHGVHKGTDFFHDPGRGTIVSMDTPAYAADAGKVIRADYSFQDMNASVYSRVIYECHSSHESSEHNEDLLRGCQVWIDHGNGLITKYAHLDKIKPGLRKGMTVNAGDLVGFVGVSGTGENLPGRAKHPHLHFEVWLDGKYVGSGLTPSETIGVYEDIFGRKRS